MSWLPLALFVPHMIEEFPRFPAWATRHFGATSRAWYVYSHVVLVAVMVAIGWGARHETPLSAGVLLVVAVQCSLAGNALFHLATTARFREVSPGVFTGTVLFLPAAAWMLVHVVQGGLLSRTQLGSAIALGAGSQVLVVASLWLPMDIDWTGRRRLTVSTSTRPGPAAAPR